MTLYNPDVVEAVVAQVADRLGPVEAEAFRAAYLDALDRTISVTDRRAFVITGDIPAMWLRDSTAQLTPYLHLLRDDPVLADTVGRVVERQLEYICLDPYANAFNDAPNRAGHPDDATEMSAWTWERKYEIDSLCYPLQLGYDLWRITGRTDHLLGYGRAARAALRTWSVETDHEALSGYRFQRFDAPVSDTLERDGRGGLVAPAGLTWAGFRPSDDACELGYNIPGNIFAAVVLTYVEEIARQVLDDQVLADDAEALRGQLELAIAAHGVVSHEGTAVYAYEVDGLGRQVLMDDANVPSLLSLPLLGWCTVNDSLYLATRRLVLSGTNPYFYQGSAASGIGSPHTPEGWIWPIGLAVQGLTAESAPERAAVLRTLLATDGGTGRMHESFHADDPTRFTRPWFSWANAMFCELVLDVADLRTYRRDAVVRGAMT